MAEFDVQLWIYDLSGGSVKSLSQMMLGRQIDGIWHTSTVVHGEEIFFGAGVQRAIPGLTPFGQPLQKVDMGTTRCVACRNLLRVGRVESVLWKYGVGLGCA
mmetsp:Transcript_42457/g.127279  ORF Transcript_42457/g.127279 Transcript_42457/m.127279 type:complete len:102 (-) Transcript_42457:1431-1736(-)